MWTKAEIVEVGRSPLALYHSYVFCWYLGKRVPVDSHRLLPTRIRQLLDLFSAAVFPAAEESPRFRFRQNVLNEMHFPRLLLEAAERAFGLLQLHTSPLLRSRSKDSMHAAASGLTHLMSSAYALLTLLLSGNFSSVEAVLAVRGSVRQMLLHQAAAASQHHGSAALPANCSPPLMRLVETSKMAPLDRLSSLQLISLEEVRLLLDDVYDSILQGKVPSQFPYQFLAKVCSIVDFQQVEFE